VDVPLVLGLRDGLLEGLPLGFHAPLRRFLPLGLPESDRRGVVGGSVPGSAIHSRTARPWTSQP
jgi:hypothetical protein